MITAVDTNVLLDVLGADPTFGPRSADALRRCLQEGSLVACDVVWTELRCFVPDAETIHTHLETLGVGYQAVSLDGAMAAGQAWQAYRRKGGKRERVAADFLIGAHAATQCERLLTRDRGFYRTYFQGLTVLDPSR
jgi:predicted nucleic acid-binding protein